MPNETRIRSWLELARAIANSADGTWIFRGEASISTDRPLRPKAGRDDARKKPYDPEDEKRALESFKRQARPHLNHTPLTDVEWLAIAQHHGMSTRLLDWTESFLVAAYFSVLEAGTKGDSVIYGVQGLSVITAKEERRPFKLKNVKLYRPPHISPRIPAQRSVFTIHPDPTEDFSSPSLTRWVVLKSACWDIKKILNACAINEASLFPDLDGLSRHLGWSYKWAKFPP
jgi:hypothetical protein